MVLTLWYTPLCSRLTSSRHEQLCQCADVLSFHHTVNHYGWSFTIWPHAALALFPDLSWKDCVLWNQGAKLYGTIKLFTLWDWSFYGIIQQTLLYLSHTCLGEHMGKYWRGDGRGEEVGVGWWALKEELWVQLWGGSLGRGGHEWLFTQIDLRREMRPCVRHLWWENLGLSHYPPVRACWAPSVRITAMTHLSNCGERGTDWAKALWHNRDGTLSSVTSKEQYPNQQWHVFDTQGH